MNFYFDSDTYRELEVQMTELSALFKSTDDAITAAGAQGDAENHAATMFCILSEHWEKFEKSFAAKVQQQNNAF